MEIDEETTEASREYATAYAAHYTGRDLPLALQLYIQLLEVHSNTQEADYSRMQIENIVSVVLSKQQLLDAKIEMVLALFERDGLVSSEGNLVSPASVDIPT
ncbi:MAG: hypothetical protein KDB27_04540 [Planctomycetales bacterium]|nr:hypothetical protein [Planctomycetales bacterium]